MTMTAEQLAQLRVDIECRKTMPAFGPDTSIERLTIINATQRSFTPEIVEALLDELARINTLIAEQDKRMVDYAAIATKNAGRVAELESRTVTVKLPESPGPMSLGAKTVYCGIVADVVASFQQACAAAGINLTVEG